MRATLAVFGLLLAAGPGRGDEAAEKKKLEGVWRCVAVQRNAKEFPSPKGAEDELVVGADGLLFKVKVIKAEVKAGYALDPSQSPRHIDVKLKADGKDDVVRKGIYELDGETLRLGLGAPGGDRPKSFDEKGVIVEVYRRHKD